jgi:predicted  nucleic acid-binding Zn-ribbon protein
MTDDELNRKIDFIVEQQAQFTSDIQRLTDRQERFQGDLERLTGTVDALTAAVESTRETAATAVEVSMTLIERYQELASAQTETQRTMDRLARAMLQHVSDGHGGGPASSPPGA